MPFRQVRMCLHVHTYHFGTFSNPAFLWGMLCVLKRFVMRQYVVETIQQLLCCDFEAERLTG